MKCIKCGCSGMEKMLHRTNPLGQTDAGWMCIDCIEKHELELSKNIKGDSDYKVLLDIEKAVHHNPNNLMTSNCEGEKCPKCGAKEIDAMTPATVYECGSSDYDQRPNTFKQSDECKKRV